MSHRIHWLTQVVPGSSGTWVVEGRALLGVITAVYDKMPYAHMVPIKSVITGIESMFDQSARRVKVAVVSQGQIESTPSGMPNRKPDLDTIGNSENLLRKRSRYYSETLELLSYRLMVILIGLVSCS
jgi:hypothetical protein